MYKQCVSRLLVSIIVISIALGSLCNRQSHADDSRIILQLSGKISVEVLPRIELLAGVLSHTSWMDQMGPRGNGNRYFQALHQFLAPYQDHQAIQLAETLTQQGFAFDAPPEFLMHLSPLPALEPRYHYPDSLIQEAGGKEQLEAFRFALRDLAEQSDFPTFLKEHEFDLKLAVRKAVLGVDVPRLTSWMETLYGNPIDDVHLVVAPAMFRAGYGGDITTDEISMLYVVLCEKGQSEDSPQFWTGPELAERLTYLWNYLLIEPFIEEHASLFQESDLSDLYSPVQQYVNGSLQDFFLQTIARAVLTMQIAECFEDERLANELLLQDLIQGYYLSRFTVEQLRYYQAHRDEFPCLKDFLPVLLRQYTKYKDTLLSNFSLLEDRPKEDRKALKTPHTQDSRIVVALSDRVYAEILPRMELLAGVLSQTIWIDRHRPQGLGNEYFQALQAFFKPYRGHKAVEFAEALTKSGFAYSAPPWFMLHLSQLPDLAPVYGYYNDALIQRANGIQTLEYFRDALKDLATQSDFLAFFEQHRTELEQVLCDTLQGFDATPVITWLEKFYGWSADEYHVVFAPALFPGGGYGIEISPDKQLLIYQVVREEGKSQQQPEFPQAQRDLPALTLHEFSHSFTNPSLKKYDDLIQELQLIEFYTPIENKMMSQAYGSLLHFLDETLVRSITIMALLDLYGDEKRYEQDIRSDVGHGFYLNRFTIQQLRYYQQHRDQYPRLDAFIPYLLQQYVDNKETLLQLY